MYVAPGMLRARPRRLSYLERGSMASLTRMSPYTPVVCASKRLFLAKNRKAYHHWCGALKVGVASVADSTM